MAAGLVLGQSVPWAGHNTLSLHHLFPVFGSLYHEWIFSSSLVTDGHGHNRRVRDILRVSSSTNLGGNIENFCGGLGLGLAGRVCGQWALL